MVRIGFSTGALAPGDVRHGVALQRRHALGAIELSALRESELDGFLAEIPSLELDVYSYVSVHAPSRLERLSEEELCERLRELPDEWPIVVHPDVISDSRPWRKLGSRICIENMDLRKKVGQRAEDLEPFMEELPEAGFCLDLAHAGQVDPSMEEARRFLDRFGPRLMQVHISRLGNVSQHLHLDPHSAENYREIGRSIPEDVPVIIESVVAEEEIEQEIARVKEVFER